MLFEEFDELILLKSGGRLVYHSELGHDSRKLIGYFESHEGKKCPPDANPAEYMLEVIGAGDPQYHGQDWGDVWEHSKENNSLSEEIQHVIEERRDASTESGTKDQREYAMPLGTQVYTVVHRNFVAYWRSKDYLLGKFMLHIFTGKKKRGKERSGMRPLLTLLSAVTGISTPSPSGMTTTWIVIHGEVC